MLNVETMSLHLRFTSRSYSVHPLLCQLNHLLHAFFHEFRDRLRRRGLLQVLVVIIQKQFVGVDLRDSTLNAFAHDMLWKAVGPMQDDPHIPLLAVSVDGV